MMSFLFTKKNSFFFIFSQTNCDKWFNEGFFD